MRLSTGATEGMRLCFMLALSKSPLSASQLVRQTDVGMKYLEQLLAMLKRGEIVYAFRGKSGGYILGGGRVPRTTVRVGRMRRYLLSQPQRFDQAKRRYQSRVGQRDLTRHSQRLSQQLRRA